MSRKASRPPRSARRAPAARRPGAAPRPQAPLSALDAVARAPWLPWAGLALALALAAWVQASALRTFFAQDDLAFLARARGLDSSPWPLLRPLAGAWRWEAFAPWFGLDPLPWHAVNLAFHLANTALVWFTARRLSGGAGVATAAAILFGTASVAFTPLHWVSGLGELLVTTGALGCLALHLAVRGRRGWAWGLLPAVALLAALLAKETAVLLPLALLVVELRAAEPPSRPGTLVPTAAVAVAAGVAFLATHAFARSLGGEPYASSLDPRFLAVNLATYLRWAVTPWVPVRDAFAAADPSALAPGTAALIAAGAAIALARPARRHLEEAGAAWFALALAPVLPLLHHSYLYYLYLPWAGACWLVAALGGRLLAPLPRRAAWAIAAVALGAAAWTGHTATRAREHATTGELLADRTVRESTLLRNAVASLDSAALAPGTRVAFVNPAPRLHSALAPGAPTTSYLPLEQVLGPGGGFRLFFPALRYVGFADSIPPAWEDAEVFLFHDDGSLRRLGRGSRALAELGLVAVRVREIPRADRWLGRSMAHGDTLPDALFGRVATADLMGRHAEARALARAFVRRWPDDPRAGVLREQLGRAAGGP